ncbi:MAG: hypothetical protein RMJ43_07630 [Chloroherpetonaceae bacterium]|nr:hypothetical protein [Chloroherpetonaceae bacterium]
MTRRDLLQGLCGLAGAWCAGAEVQTSGQMQEPVSRPSRVRFRIRELNPDSDFEAACAADVNGDGRLEVICGDTYYEGPDYRPRRFREIGYWGKGPDATGYRHDFAALPMDVNGDGHVDIVSAEWATAEVSWWENVGDGKGMWPKHVIARPGNCETAIFAPILGRGRPCILPNVAQQVVWYELRRPGKTPEWVEHVVGKEGAGHGCGWGDVNGDGKIDIVTPRGWYEQIDARRDRWIWHPDWNCDPGDCSIGMLVLDVDGDGRNDIVFGSGHNYGVYWLQQQPPGNAKRWVQRVIDRSWSQAHSMLLAPIEGGRWLVILTGKRYKAHDHDPGADDPLGIYYYTYDRRAGQWQKFVVTYGTRVGAGLQLSAVDLRKTGRLDIIAPGKTGLYVLENEGR